MNMITANAIMSTAMTTIMNMHTITSTSITTTTTTATSTTITTKRGRVAIG